METDRQGTVLERLEADVARITSQSAEELRSQTICEMRRRAMRKTGFVTRFVSWFPFAGRGNVMRERIKDSKTINDMLDEALRQ